VKAILKVLSGSTVSPPPIWLMRQAGRYLPEYREVRRQAGSFLDLCFTPELAAEVTLQPIRRYGFDAAILFSDILVVPHALGQRVWFEDNVGPKLEAISGPQGLGGLDVEALPEALSPCYETLRILRRELPAEVALIGFAGAPWTVASYMIEGGGSRDYGRAKRWAYEDPESFARLIDLLVEATTRYLSAQVEAGAEVLQIFESWASAWPAAEFERWCLAPMAEIIRRLKQRHPEVPIILFPRGIGAGYLGVAERAGADALSLDPTVPLDWARETLAPKVVLQGNLDPMHLIVGGPSLDVATRQILAATEGLPFIFNLGHGIDKSTPPAHVERLVALVRGEVD
jgi:uroporphyrinogen decarboxylase